MTTESTKHPKWASWLVIVISLSLIGTCVMICSDDTSAPPTTLSREDQIKKAFHPWDGAHIKLEQWVKQSMNDPDSYEHVETKYRESGGDSVFVIMTFRGKNAFGGIVKNTVVCWTSIDGNLLGTPVKTE